MPTQPHPQNLTSFCFTINNPTDSPDELVDILKPRCHFIVFQREKGESGTEHFQGYAECTKRTAFTVIKKLIPTAHIERRMGTRKQAIDYCTKQDSYMDSRTQYQSQDYLPPSERQGKRGDIANLISDARSGMSFDDLSDKHGAAYARYHKFIDRIKANVRPPLRLEEVIVLYGETGTGKTYYAHSRHEDLFEIPIAPKGSIWYDGYDDHEHALIDEFKGQQPLNEFMRVIDRYVRKVPIKGSHVWFRPKTIYITSNFPPNEWYKWEGRELQLPALMRRFTKVLHVKHDNVIEDMTDYFKSLPPPPKQILNFTEINNDDLL